MRRVTVTYVIEADDDRPVDLARLLPAPTEARPRPQAPRVPLPLTDDECALIQGVLAAVHNVTGVSEELLLGKERRQVIARARRLAMFLVRKLTLLSYPKIGAVFGAHHTTVMEACRRVLADRSRETTRHLIEAETLSRPQ